MREIARINQLFVFFIHLFNGFITLYGVDNTFQIVEIHMFIHKAGINKCNISLESSIKHPGAIRNPYTSIFNMYGTLFNAL